MLLNVFAAAFADPRQVRSVSDLPERTVLALNDTEPHAKD